MAMVPTIEGRGVGMVPRSKRLEKAARLRGDEADSWPFGCIGGRGGGAPPLLFPLGGKRPRGKEGVLLLWLRVLPVLLLLLLLRCI